MRSIPAIVPLLWALLLQPADSYKFNSSCPVAACPDSCKNNCKDGKVIGCYFTNWATYRSGIASYSPENIDPTLCTHIYYAFAILDDKTLTMVPSDEWVDYNKKFFEMVTALKKKCIKVILSIGGWNNSKGDRWHRMLSDKKARKNFVTTSTQFLLDHCFDGLDLDYEYPGCPQGDTTLYNEDKNHFVDLLTELKTEFKKVGLYLTIAVSAGKSLSTKCYNMPETCKHVDYVNIMAYDYYSYLGGKVGPQTPLLNTSSSWGLNDTIHWYLNTEYCWPNKTTLGISFGAQTYTLVDSSRPKFGDPVSGAGKAGPFTVTAGFLAYYEICYFVKNGWDSGFNRVNGSWAASGDQFISYSGIIDNNLKCYWVKEYGLAGVYLWDLDYDDFMNRCECGPYPLLTALNQQLRCHKGNYNYCY